MTNLCPHCKGDCCDPCDTGTAIVADCPACYGRGRLTDAQLALYQQGKAEGWKWSEYATKVLAFNVGVTGGDSSD